MSISQSKFSPSSLHIFKDGNITFCIVNSNLCTTISSTACSEDADAGRGDENVEMNGWTYWGIRLGMRSFRGS